MNNIKKAMIRIDVISNQVSYELKVPEHKSFKILKDIYKAYLKRMTHESFLKIIISHE
jgi:hypothetical protein